MFECQNICRLCLRDSNLGPIFLDMQHHERYTKVLYLTTGLKIEPNDCLPQSICENCTKLVNSALDLRNRSYLSEIKLRKQKYSLHNDEESLAIDAESFDINSSNDYNENNGLKEFNVEIEFDRLTAEKNDDTNEAKDQQEQFKIINAEGGKISQTDETKDQQTIQPKFQNVDGELSKSEKKAIYLNMVDGVLDRSGPVKCKICKKTLRKWSCFLGHAKLHLGFKFVCEYCGKSFVSTTQLKRHCRSYHGMRRELACKHCGYLALDNVQLVLHERRVHTGERPFVCDTCGASYHSRRCLVQHIETHRDIGTIHCTECNKMFKSRRHLARHRYSAHARSRTACPHCGRLYNRKYLRTHITKQHPDLLTDHR
ncbi:zinc finger protein 418-like [Achroia grisella]|uniref:zinc finger protein 418-like n=1 Tax=Achroia grisella TaxID=688607 RepID=UPI0027D278A2|nr:zinc finger protein 418-like [Achroia grisella]